MGNFKISHIGEEKSPHQYEKIVELLKIAQNRSLNLLFMIKILLTRGLARRIL